MCIDIVHYDNGTPTTSKLPFFIFGLSSFPQYTDTERVPAAVSGTSSSGLIYVTFTHTSPLSAFLEPNL